MTKQNIATAFMRITIASILGAKNGAVSASARARVKSQLGTVGGTIPTRKLSNKKSPLTLRQAGANQSQIMFRA
ncbi:hypothetical protein G6M26_49125 [Agrobacterium tumefaciens]|nr:hypothetical protein [Agrobacterium tumefaciens]NTE26511.1 hypothetical protein [Agrobacterium tumefaciens]